MNLRFIKSSEKKRIVSEIEERFGITKLPSVLVETGKEKIRGFSGTMTKDEILELSRIANVEVVGLYLFKKEHSLRLSHDAVHVFSSQIKKGVLEINDSQAKDWIDGKDLNLNTNEKGAIVLKYEKDFVGCGISTGEKVLNYVPKERRVRRS
jgi:NOL1/NOP2/fmu family ribosome biogenesis protein